MLKQDTKQDTEAKSQDIKQDNHTPVKKYAYVWLVMFGDRYVPGVLTSAYSIKLTNTIADLVVMVTPDVSKESIMKLSTFLKVVYVDYIKFEKKFNYADTNDKYAKWIDSSYTKWRCLDLNYDKILMLDADVLVVKNIDNVFEVKAPAGVFQHQKPIKSLPLSNYTDRFGYLRHGTVIPSKVITDILNTKDQFLAVATSMLLEPRKDTERFIDSITSMKGLQYPNITGIDEQSIAYYMSVILDKSWTVLDTRYNTVPWWYYKRTLGSAYGIVLHYMSREKPWEINPKEYDDVRTWHNVQKQMEEYIKQNMLFMIISNENSA